MIAMTDSDSRLIMSATALCKFYPRRAFPVRRAIITALLAARDQRLSVPKLARAVYLLGANDSRSVAAEMRLMQVVRTMRAELGNGWLEDVIGIKGAAVIVLNADGKVV